MFKVGDKVRNIADWSSFCGKDGEIVAMGRRSTGSVYQIQWCTANARHWYDGGDDFILITPVAPEFHGHPRFKELIDEILKLHSAKNKDYTRGGDPLGNFSRVAATISSYGRPTTPAQTSFEYMMKQVDAGGRMLFQGYEGDTEGLTERLKDVAVYALLTIINKEEEKKK